MALPGYEIGDIITIMTLAFSVYQSCKTAPKDVRDIAGEINCLRVILEETNSLIKVLEISDAFGNDKQDRLRVVATGCLDVLKVFDKLLDKFGGPGSKSMKALDRFRWPREM